MPDVQLQFVALLPKKKKSDNNQIKPVQLCGLFENCATTAYETVLEVSVLSMQCQALSAWVLSIIVFLT